VQWGRPWYSQGLTRSPAPGGCRYSSPRSAGS